MKGFWTGVAAVAAAVVGTADAASYDDIPPIEIYGQHFFYTNNGSQFYLKGVAYQQNYSPNGTTDSNASYTDPLADGAGCKRDLPYLKQIFTNVLRVYAIDPKQNHDECMEAFAAAHIYVIADLGEPKTSIVSDDPEWNVPLYQRYTSVVDALSKYKNVIGFFAGNENVSSGNQTAAAAFVKAAVRDTKGYIQSQKYRSSMGVGYATADVPTRDDLATYFACEPGNSGNATQIDFWGYNVYSWCGDSNYADSSYGERYDFFHDYPVPVFFAEYGCIEGVSGGATHRPFTEVAVLYGNMTEVFSGGIVYQWFMSENNYGLVELTDNDASVSPYPDFTSLRSELASVRPTTTARSAYSPSNSAPACPTTGSSWLPVASPLPPAVNPKLCACMASNLQCNIASTDDSKYEDVFNYICAAADGKYCKGIQHNATTGAFGALSGCSAKDQLAWVANEYYVGNKKSASACDFSGVATTQAAATASGCGNLLAAISDGTGSVPSPTDKGTAAVGTETGAASGSKSKGAAGSVSPPGFVAYGGLLGAAYAGLAAVSMAGMLVL
ncbi:carbohydrate-binding module family 43 protein [Karstenula rhodostoma CBS 690.94]|uniref:1,3-beta-glucanosyltransferase n=1 Tax=Karstenula rhodostoma CBS 690.94 TaxID=1392251 RepID=A0A9P4PVV0_9PLEO|nr:carbohydrate-binding module family 43 protein [Karstenula rhodostoma CBS 690.94]